MAFQRIVSTKSGDYVYRVEAYSDSLTWAEIGMALFHEFDANGAFLIS